MKQELIDAISNVREDEALRLARAMIDSGAPPESILDSAREAMAIIGAQFECKELYLPELILGGEILRQIAELVKPKIAAGGPSRRPLGEVVIGTVAGDIHDVGKDIVAFMLECNRFEVHDLGVDVPAARFVAKLKETGAPIVGLSGFLTLAFDQMKATVDAIGAAGLRDSVKIMIGGAPMDDKVARYVGADAFGSDASAAVRLARGWVKGD
jgi:5-methyltetrahydrofolate--homocysteine methyltransferase